MKAIVQEKYGSPDDLEVREVARPAPAACEALVRVRAASLHPDIWHAVSGQPYILRVFGGGLSKPKNAIPGTDLAGIVESVGRDVTKFQRGDAVFGDATPGMLLANGGAFAEYVCVDQDLLALKPSNITFEQAASVPTSGFIAMQNLGDWQEWRPGKKVLLNGAGGGVGTLALQMMKASGAHVTAVDTAGKADMLRLLGADEVIDYTREDFTERRVRYDFIFDVPGDRPFSALKRVLEPHGRYVPIGHEGYGASGSPVLGLIPRFLGLIAQSLFVKQLRRPRGRWLTKSEVITTLRDMLESGTLTPMVDSTFPLSRIGDAFRHLIEDELHGKVIITPQD